MKARLAGFAIAFAACFGVGYWLALTAAPKTDRRPAAQAKSTQSALVAQREELPKTKSARPNRESDGDQAARDMGAFEGERVLTFRDAESMARFLERAAGKLRIISRLDALRALRVGFANRADFERLLDGSETESYVFPVLIPGLPEGSVQSGAVALGGELLRWLGIDGDRETWGKGVMVAVLDTGVATHEAFRGGIRSLDLVAMPQNLADWNGHGTAVASLIAGNDELTPGVAPSAEIFSIRVADDAGNSNSFVLAEGIVKAVDAGAKIINISMGSFGDSAVMRDAIAYADQRGVLLVAAVGNNGIERVTYPAAYESVIAVGAVDATGEHLDFSNSGPAVDLAAPGYGVNAAWGSNDAARVTGTSFSAPIVTGAVAALMSEKNISAQKAYDLLSVNLNDGGAAGSDQQLGGGMPDVGRALQSDQPGIHDAAIASQRVLPADASNPNGRVEVVVQNRGTEMLVNTTVKVSVGEMSTTGNLSTLAPNAVATVQVPVHQDSNTASEGLRIESSVQVSKGVVDIKPSNDRRIEIHGKSVSN
ncbi:MAG: hypothetical protein RLZ22_828 [Verrucomicrobiota bacterium]|jgi:subtilisin family serine protease